MFLCLNSTTSPSSVPPRPRANTGFGITLTTFSLKSPRCLLRSPTTVLIQPALPETLCPSPASSGSAPLARTSSSPLSTTAFSPHVLSPAIRLLAPGYCQGVGNTGSSSQFERADRPPSDGMNRISPKTADADEFRISVYCSLSLFCFFFFVFDMFLFLNTGSFP